MAIYGDKEDGNTLPERTAEGGTLYKIRITIEALVSSPEYDSIDSIIDEFNSEGGYDISDSPNVHVHNTEWVDTEFVVGSKRENKHE